MINNKISVKVYNLYNFCIKLSKIRTKFVLLLVNFNCLTLKGIIQTVFFITRNRTLFILKSK